MTRGSKVPGNLSCKKTSSPLLCPQQVSDKDYSEKEKKDPFASLPPTPVKDSPDDHASSILFLADRLFHYTFNNNREVWDMNLVRVNQLIYSKRIHEQRLSLLSFSQLLSTAQSGKLHVSQVLLVNLRRYEMLVHSNKALVLNTYPQFPQRDLSLLLRSLDSISMILLVCKHETIEGLEWFWSHCLFVTYSGCETYDSLI